MLTGCFSPSTFRCIMLINFEGSLQIAPDKPIPLVYGR